MKKDGKRNGRWGGDGWSTIMVEGEGSVMVAVLMVVGEERDSREEKGKKKMYNNKRDLRIRNI